jgi:hypothetical protein
VIRGRFSAGAALLVITSMLLAGGCSGGASAPAITLDGSPRFANDEGVVSAVSLTSLTLDGKRTYKVDRKMRAFDTTTLQAVPLLTRKGMFVQIGHGGRTVAWLASYTLVVSLPGRPTTSFHTGKLKAPDKGRAVFTDGSVLSVAPGIVIPRAGREARADIDVGTHRVRAFTVTA